MRNNVQSRRDRLNSDKIAAAHERTTTQPVDRGLRAKVNPVDDATPTEMVKHFPSGVVVNCQRLNVRKGPSTDAEILTTIKASSEVKIDTDTSTDEFYKIHTDAGIEGFCMKKYITLKG